MKMKMKTIKKIGALGLTTLTTITIIIMVAEKQGWNGRPSNYALRLERSKLLSAAESVTVIRITWRWQKHNMQPPFCAYFDVFTVAHESENENKRIHGPSWIILVLYSIRKTLLKSQAHGRGLATRKQQGGERARKSDDQMHASTPHSTMDEGWRE